MKVQSSWIMSPCRAVPPAAMPSSPACNYAHLFGLQQSFQEWELNMKRLWKLSLGPLALFATVTLSSAPALAQQPKQPNILVIMGDDVGWLNIGAYHQG